MLLISTLVASLLFTTDIEFRSSTNQTDALAALSDLDSAMSEVLWRLNLTPGGGAPPAGSTISVNGLVSYDASLDPDPWNLLGNEVDDDGDGTVDDADELMANREWTARVVLTPAVPDPGSPWEVDDDDPATGPPWGAKRVEATVQPQAGWKEYTTDDVASPDVLTGRFLLDTDTALGDSEGDGPEIVFYDPLLPLNREEDANTLTALGGDADPANDSPYNITWSDGVTVHPASGSPVLLVTTKARIRRGGKVVAEREIRAQVVNPVRPVMSKALCGCTTVEMGSSSETDSYKSSQGAYPGWPNYDHGNVGSNGNLELRGAVFGDAEAGGWITGAGSLTRDATAGSTIAGTPGGTAYPNWQPPPQPCECDVVDVDTLVAEAAADNDNASLPVACRGPNLTLTGNASCTLDCGTYYYNRIRLAGNASIVVGDVSCGPVQVFISESADFGGTGLVNANRPEDLQIYASVAAPNEIDLGGTSDFVGVVYAPEAEIVLHGTTEVFGAILGKNIDGNGGPHVHYDEDLASFWRVESRYKVVAWSEVE
jgi:hypothetical protein